jgi:hypothetical protein
MSFLLGVSILIPITWVFNFLNNFRYNLSKEFAMIPVLAMFFVDALLVFMFYTIFADMAEESLFRKGIAAGFAIGSLVKCGILLKQTNEKV